MSRNQSRRRGLTLVEMLVVTGIFAILSGLVFTVVTNARLEARRTPLIAQLRNVGVAAELYATDRDFDEVTPPLVRAGLLPPATLSTPFDPTVEGLMNRERAGQEPPALPVTPWRDSVLTAGEKLGPEYRRKVSALPSYGWAVLTARTTGENDPNRSGVGPVTYATQRGPAFRLRKDGGVRRFDLKWEVDPKSGTEYFSAVWLFVDRSDLKREGLEIPL